MKNYWLNNRRWIKCQECRESQMDIRICYNVSNQIYEYFAKIYFEVINKEIDKENEQ